MDSEKAVKNVKIMYILNLVGIVIGFTPIIAVVWAYMSKDEGPEWLQSHYEFIIRTFWITLVASIVGVILCVILIGILLLLALAVWMIIRNIKGIQAIDKEEAIADPKTFTW